MKCSFSSSHPILAISALFFLLINNSLAQDSTGFLHNFNLNSNQLSTLPMRDLPQFYHGLFAGTIVQDYRGEQQLHVQGSRFDEIDYSFENINIRSIFSGQPLFVPIYEGLASLFIQNSPDAASSSASALVSQKMLPGGDELRLAFLSSNDNFTTDYEKKFDTYSYGHKRNLFLASGSLKENSITFSTAIENEQYGDHYRRFWPGFNYQIPEGDNIYSHLDASIFEAGEIVVSPGNIPNASSDRWAAQSIISAKTAAGNFDFVHLFHWQKKQINTTPIESMFNSARIPENRTKNNAISLHWQNNIFWEIDANVQIDRIKAFSTTYDPVHKDNFLAYYDSAATAEKGIVWEESNTSRYAYVDENTQYYYDPGQARLFYFPFDQPGHVIFPNYNKREENTFNLRAHFTRDFGSHKIAVGTKINTHRMHYFQVLNSPHLNINVNRFDLDLDRYEVENDAGWESIKEYFNVYGYTFGGKKSDGENGFEGPKKSREFTLYLSDQIEYQRHTFNAGLQYVNYNNGEKIFSFPDNPSYPPWKYDAFPDQGFGIKKSPSNQYFLPRFAWHYMISEKSALNISWGKYAQQPRFQDVYLSYIRRFLNAPWYSGHDFSGGGATPIESNNMNITYMRQFSTQLSAKAGFYYRKSDNLLQCKRIEVSPLSSYWDYTVLANDGESIAKGLTLELNFRNRHWMIWGNYTLSNVNGPNSYPLTNMSAEHYYEPDFYPLPGDKNFDYNQTHRINLLASLTSPGSGNFILRNWKLHSLFRYNSGHDIDMYDGNAVHTISTGAILADGNSRGREYYLGHITTPANYLMDLQIDRGLSILGFQTTVFMRFQNLFNRKNVLHVYRRSGSAENDTFFKTESFRSSYWGSYSPETIQLHELINNGQRQHYASVEGGDLFGHPREIHFGFKVGFRKRSNPN
ncbi:MAG: TonB-dependent receptor [Calditrichaeota bacterium]|nr:MAG: TonB-dependent receptor [Calditrichota bacterium]